MKTLFILFAASIFQTSAWAFPIPREGGPIDLPATFTADYNFAGIVALSNCSGSLMALENSQDTDNAIVMTNGHCLESGFLRAGQTLISQNSSRLFELMDSLGQVVGRLHAI